MTRLILLALLLSALLAGCAPEPEEGLPPNVEAGTVAAMGLDVDAPDGAGGAA